MKAICAFGELANFVHVEMLLLFKTHKFLVNSNVSPKYDVSWNCLLLYPLSLNVGPINIQKATLPLFGPSPLSEKGS